MSNSQKQGISCPTTHWWTRLSNAIRARPVLATAVDRATRLEKSNDATEQQRREAELRKFNRGLSTMSACHEAFVNAKDEIDLLGRVCRTVIKKGSYRLAWVGYVEDGADKGIRPVAQAGFEEGYLETLNLTWADTERGRGPAGTAIRTGQPCCARDVATDPHFAPWRENALQRGYSSVLSLPLKKNDHVLGTLSIAASEPDAFDATEVVLLRRWPMIWRMGLRRCVIAPRMTRRWLRSK